MAEIERMAALCMKDLDDDEELGDEDLDDDDLLVTHSHSFYILTETVFGTILILC